MTVLFDRTTNPKCIALHIKPPYREKIILWENMSELALYSFPYRHWIKNTISLFASKALLVTFRWCAELSAHLRKLDAFLSCALFHSSLSIQIRPSFRHIVLPFAGYLLLVLVL